MNRKSPGKMAGRILSAAVIIAAAAHLEAQEPPRSRAVEVREMWNDIGNKLLALAQEVPAEKHEFKAQQDERSFADNLLHVAAVDYDLIGRISGSRVGPDFGKDIHNPSR